MNKIIKSISIQETLNETGGINICIEGTYGNNEHRTVYTFYHLNEDESLVNLKIYLREILETIDYYYQKETEFTNLIRKVLKLEPPKNNIAILLEDIQEKTKQIQENLELIKGGIDIVI